MADFTTLRGQVEQLRLFAMQGQSAQLEEQRREARAFLWLAQQEQGQVILAYLARVAFYAGVPSSVQLGRVITGGTEAQVALQAAKAHLAAELRSDEVWLQAGVRWLVHEIFQKIIEAPAVLQQEEA